jgi:hypothetical protein
MKQKLLSSIACILLTSIAFAQTIVSTTPENKKVILEEFTGINCVFCPDGHAIANSIQNNNPGNVFLVNIHAGGFATPSGNQPDFRTSEGNGIRAYFGANFYPSGMINRHAFAGGTVLSRSAWASSANQILGESSYVNMAVEADIDVQTNEITVHVEAYYTDDSPVGTNKLNIALLQNNTLGPQTGGNMGDEYVHMHRLIDMVTGQWGEDITPTTSGTFIDRTYTMTIPTDLNGVPIEIADLELVVFMAEGNAEIISGNGTFPTYSNFELQNDVFLKEIKDIEDQCVNTLSPVVVIQNMGENPVTSLDIEYGVNGNSYTHSWTGTLNPLQNETITLPEIPFNFEGTNNVIATISDDENNNNNQQVTAFADAQEYTGDLTLEINTDNWGGECTWNVKDWEGTIVANGGPYGNNQTYIETISLPSENCYTFNLIDSYGDGGRAVILSDADLNILYQTTGNYGSGESKNFGYKQIILGVSSNNLFEVVLYPNPAKTTVTITNAENANVVIYDVLGKAVLNQNNISLNQEISISNLQLGTYFVKIEKEGQTKVERLIISK